MDKIFGIFKSKEITYTNRVNEIKIASQMNHTQAIHAALNIMILRIPGIAEFGVRITFIAVFSIAILLVYKWV